MSQTILLETGPIAWLAAHWETLLLILLLGGAGLWVFRSTLAVYGHIFFPARAVRNAFIKTVLMVALLFAIYAVPYWLFQVLLPPGWARSLSFLLSFVLFDVLWEGAGRLLDRLLVGR
jgi:cytochrome c oxidase assembly factor CtaG